MGGRRVSKTNFEKVKEFHRAFGVPSAEKPTEPSRDLYHLRVGLIDEELSEFVEGHYESTHQDADFMPDLIEIADAIGDMLYVVYGTADQYGLDADAIFAEVHRSNCSKLGSDGRPIYREDGKVLKGPNFSPPDLEKIVYGSQGG